ncbi:MAG: hypothetical protein ACR2J3_11370 [Aridibacter sp.]
MKYTLFTIYVSLAILITNNQLCFAQINPANSTQKQTAQQKKLEKIKNKVLNIGVGGKITVIHKNKKKFFGTVTDVTDDDFEIKEVDLKTNLNFDYSDVNKIHSGDGEKNFITGKRANPQKGWLYGGAVVAAVFIIAIVGLSQRD